MEELQLAFDFIKEELVTEEEVDAQYERVMDSLEKLELRNMLRREEDKLGAVLKINSGLAAQRVRIGRRCSCVCISDMRRNMVTRPR